MSANQFARTLGLTRKSAWFVAHRIREAMAGKPLGTMGGGGEIVEADETYFGPKKEQRTEAARGHFTKSGKTGPSNKRAIVSLVQRGGEIRSFHVDRADKQTVARIVTENVAREARLFTDESRLYLGADGHVAEHQSVKHSDKEYARGEVHTNTVEGSFSIFKRGMKGVYQHCDEKHLHRYLAEFDFRYNNRVGLGVDDTARAVKAIKGAAGKRLTYRRTGHANAITEAQG